MKEPADEHVAALTPPPVTAPRPRAHPPRPDNARQVAARPEHAPAAADGAGSGAGPQLEATSGGGGGVPGAGPGEGSGAGSGGGTGQGTGSARGDGAGGDLRAACASCPAPEYPARARRQGWQGTVDVDVRVGGDGAVEEASVGRSSGFAALDTAAVSVARRSRFRVAGGTAVSGQLRYRFVLESGERPL
jgi:protein TonB